MNEPLYTSQIVSKARKHIDALPSALRVQILDEIEMLCVGNLQSLEVKPVRGKIKELIVKNYRILFFPKAPLMYFVHIFRKQTNKTPHQDIEYAEKLHKLIQEL